MRRSVSLSWALVVPIAATVALWSGACSSTRPGSTVCPEALPGSGSACPSVVSCEYGPNADGACATIAWCIAAAPGTFTWQISSPPAGCGTHGPTCPASFTALPPETACSLSDPVCDYAEGRCACAPCSSGAGSPSSTEGAWECLTWPTGGAGCPTPRPLAGNECTSAQEGLTCNYAYLCSGVPEMGPLLVCEHGTWTQTFSTASCVAPPRCAGIGDAGAD
jgi:hypothetical protein